MISVPTHKVPRGNILHVDEETVLEDRVLGSSLLRVDYGESSP